MLPCICHKLCIKSVAMASTDINEVHFKQLNFIEIWRHTTPAVFVHYQLCMSSQSHLFNHSKKTNVDYLLTKYWISVVVLLYAFCILKIF